MNALRQTIFTRNINKPLLTSYGCNLSVATCPVRYLASHSSLLRGCITNDVNCTWDIILHPCTSGHISFRLSRATALLTFTQEVHRSNLDWDTDYLQGFRGLHQSLSANAFKWVTIPSFLRLTIHYSLYQLRELLSSDNNCGGSSNVAVNLTCLQTPLQMVHFAV
jgi:hypothetical protein